MLPMKDIHTISIVLQLILMFGSYFLFFYERFWMTMHGKYRDYRHELPAGIFTCETIASGLFMMQHTLFVGQYARVAIALPLTFCYQTNEVRRKKKFRMSVVLTCEIMTAILLIGVFTFQEVSDRGYTFGWIIWSGSAIVLAAVLGYCFWCLKKL